MGEVRAWKTDDGKLWDTQSAAVTHEVTRGLRELMEGKVFNGVRDELIARMLKNADRYASLFTRYCQSHPPLFQMDDSD